MYAHLCTYLSKEVENYSKKKREVESVKTVQRFSDVAG